jgi:phosphate transport system substrate-binding protein
MAAETARAIETAAHPRPRGRAEAPAEDASPGGGQPGSGSHVLGAFPAALLPDEGSVGLPQEPDPATWSESLFTPSRSVRWPYYAVAATVILVLAVVALRPANDNTGIVPLPAGQSDGSNRQGKELPAQVIEKRQPMAASSFALSGAGSSFIDPMMQKWSLEYKRINGLTVGYEKSGSSSGVRDMIGGHVAFACTDAYLSDGDRREQDRKGGFVYVPLVLGAVVIVYNLPELTEPLHITGEILAAIYTDEIKNWDKDSIKVANRGVDLPNRPITVIHRSGSGTTFILSDYLSKVSTKWKGGSGASPEWPKGPRWKEVESNAEVAREVKRTPGAIGYVELNFAKEQNLSYALLKNDAGKWVGPSSESVTSAATHYLKPDYLKKNPLPADLCFTLTNPPGDDSYPIVGITWAVLYKTYTRTPRKELIDFLRWAVTDGQKYAADLHYARLPSALGPKIDEVLKSISPNPSK